MHVRCSYCRQSFNLSREFVTQAVAEAEEKRHKYVAIECINCRKQMKVGVKQMKPYALREEASEEENDNG